MILWCYSVLMRLAQPLLRRKLRRRGQAEPGYLQAVGERWGHYDIPASQGWIWIHAVSLGETRAAAVLLAALRERLPDMRLLLTHGTATGRAEGRALLREGDVQVWQPWDTPQAVQRFVAHFQPRVGILMETEMWPNLAAQCARARIPLVLANARLSELSARRTHRLAWLARPAYESLVAVWAQTEDDARRLRELGAPVHGVVGNIKFDAAPDAAQLRKGRAWQASITRPVMMLASSREGEELMLVQALRQVIAAAQWQWLVVPRHPQRFDEVAALLEREGLSVSRRSTWAGSPSAAQVWLGDSLGEMALYYGMSQAALLGGSFAPLGGQNLIEAAACGCPVLMGPHTFNFAQAAELAVAGGAAFVVDNMPQALQRLQLLLAQPARLQAARDAAVAFAGAHQGAARRTAQEIVRLISR